MCRRLLYLPGHITRGDGFVCFFSTSLICQRCRRISAVGSWSWLFPCPKKGISNKLRLASQTTTTGAGRRMPTFGCRLLQARLCAASLCDAVASLFLQHYYPQEMPYGRDERGWHRRSCSLPYGQGSSCAPPSHGRRYHPYE